MLPSNAALRSSLRTLLSSSLQCIAGELGSATWSELAARHSLCKLRRESIVLRTSDQLAAAAAMIELDGIARRIVLCPADLADEHLSHVVRAAQGSVVLSEEHGAAPGNLRIEQTDVAATGAIEQESLTEWVLLTSGTTGQPKLVAHTLESLAGAIPVGHASPSTAVWSTFYDIRRYGGLQIFLRAALTGSSLVLSGKQESTSAFLARVGALGVTHISGTPSHWRSALMSPAAAEIAPVYVRLSGEIADQALLDQLRARYPKARIVHAFASTEAGLAFEIEDGRMGIPGEAIGLGLDRAVETKIEDGTLRVRSNYSASRYLGNDPAPLKDEDGFINTGDVLERDGERYYFRGRRDGTINVGGNKVHPEEVEAVLNSHPEVSGSRVGTKKSSITGALVIADVVPKHSTAERSEQALRQELLRYCRQALPAWKVPVAITFVPELAVSEAGKLIRAHA
jgi:acyl-coenzyme A synthetase/AMP-(fatty) acid ligase